MLSIESQIEGQIGRIFPVVELQAGNLSTQIVVVINPLQLFRGSTLRSIS